MSMVCWSLLQCFRKMVFFGQFRYDWLRVEINLDSHLAFTGELNQDPHPICNLAGIGPLEWLVLLGLFETVGDFVVASSSNLRSTKANIGMDNRLKGRGSTYSPRE